MNHVNFNRVSNNKESICPFSTDQKRNWHIDRCYNFAMSLAAIALVVCLFVCFFFQFTGQRTGFHTTLMAHVRVYT